MAYTPKIINAGVYSQEDINTEFSKIATELSKLLSRVASTEDNAMHANLDMNQFRILNLPEPTEPTDAIRVVDLLEGPVFQKIIDALVARGY